MDYLINIKANTIEGRSLHLYDQILANFFLSYFFIFYIFFGIDVKKIVIEIEQQKKN